MSPQIDGETRDRAIALFTFLKELTQLRTKTIRNIEQFEKVIWFHEIPQTKECFQIIGQPPEIVDKSEAWITIRKPKLKTPPPTPTSLKLWLEPGELKDSSRDFPTIKDRIPIEYPETEVDQDDETLQPKFKELSEHPEIKETWERYVENEWWPWAEEDRRLQLVQNVYTELFSIYQKQQTLGEAYEVVIGLGYLAWKTPDGHQVKRHLVVTQANLNFDANRGVINLGPPGEGAKLILEQDMLEPSERPDSAVEKDILISLEKIGNILWDPEEIPAALRSWINAVSPEGKFEETFEPQKVVEEDPRVHLAPPIILRKRTERSLLLVFKEIIDQLNKGEKIPMGVRRLVTIIDDIIPVEVDVLKKPDRAIPQETYFPLPTNKEQEKIVKLLETRQGVLVHGPPGTGKSHTIANLICHLLANRKRVLVTSETKRALKVLKEKIPAKVADLCVVLLGNDQEAMKSLENSVRGITNQYNLWNEREHIQKISEFEKDLDKARKAEALQLAEMRSIRERETYQHNLPFGSYQGTAQVIAKRLREEELRYSWLFPQPPEELDPPLADEEGVELLALLRQIDVQKEEELLKDTINHESLVTAEEFLKIVNNEANAYKAYLTAEKGRSYPCYSILARFTMDLLNGLKEDFSVIIASSEGFFHHFYPWVKKAAKEILTGRGKTWQELFLATQERLTLIGERVRQVSNYQIKGVEDRDRLLVKAHAKSLLNHFEAGGRLKCYLPIFLRPKPVKEGIYIIREVRVDGQLCDNPEALRKLLEWLEINEHLEALRNYWSNYLDIPNGPSSTQAAKFREIYELLERVLDLTQKVKSIKNMLQSSPGTPEPNWSNMEDLQAWKGAVEAAIFEKKLRMARAEIGELEKSFSAVLFKPNNHPVIGKTLDAIRSRDVRLYSESYQKLEELKRLREKLKTRETLISRLKAGCPDFAENLIETCMDHAWDARISEFANAWNWGRADGWLKRLHDPPEYERLSQEVTRHRKLIKEVMGELAAAKAWRHCLTKLNEHERQHLMAWSEAMKRLGKGTGKHAYKYRAAAREHMDNCRSAIPAWIMPLYRVVETIRPGTDAFDVVIIDEASQSGPQALFLHYLGKKIVVVGDDKQVSPESIGLELDQVDRLRRQYLSEIPFNDSLGIEHSFFDQAKIRFAGRVTLTEHFRCMPEIIQFSNNLCYSSEPLIPLKQYGSGRLEPVVKTDYIPNGYQKGHSPRIINPPEAEAIVEQVEKCCSADAYEKKTMGVISLLGEYQAREIEKLLLKRIGPEEIERRQLVCGDADAFQGDERDVVFLSLVSAPTEGHRIGVLSGARYERRFNVAASRAKEQMWLFHTATINDLSPNCLRYQLLRYCQNPRVQPFSIAGINLEELRMLAQSIRRDRESPPRPFDSWFEVDVFLKIIDRGYRVIPQFEVAGKFIDLMVEGMRGRLAVECDGDTSHGADRYEEDMARQRDLERCGLTFWRVRGGDFYRDPEASLQGLWDTLEKHRIYPAKTEPKDEEKITKKPKQNESLERKDEAIKEVPEALETDESNTFLKPYERWESHPLPDPLISNIEDVVKYLIEIIAAEGPMPCHRAYHIFSRAAGIRKVGRQIRAIFNRAVAKAGRSNLIEERNEHGSRDQLNQIVRKAGTPAVVPRKRGDRTIYEIPPAEIGALMEFLRNKDPAIGSEELIQSVLKYYEIGRLTSNIRNMLLKIADKFINYKNSG